MTSPAQKTPIHADALLKLANDLLKAHEDYQPGMRADSVQERGGILVFQGEYFLNADGTPSAKTMAVFNLFKKLAQELSGHYQLSA
ncbi:MAG: DUF2498 family protein [Aeromonas sp.]